MKSLRTRIVLTWICYIVMAASLASKSSVAILAFAICALAASSMRSSMQPAFPKRTRRRLVYWAMFLTVVATLMLGAWLQFADPWKQICWTLMAISLGFQAFEDAKVWRGVDHVA
jgi:hypothetical protein